MDRSRTPMVPDHGQTTVHIKVADNEDASSAQRPIRVIAWDADGYPLTVGARGTEAEGRLIRAQDREDFLHVGVRRHASEREVDVAAAAGWRCRIVELGPHWERGAMDWPVEVGDVYPVIMWRYLGPTDVRPVIPRPSRPGPDGKPGCQRGYDPIEMKMIVHLLAPGE